MLNLNINLITENNKIYATSRDIAEKLNKDHDKVCNKIKEVLTVAEFCDREFITEKGNKYKEYLLTKDGFVLLLMNYTGYNEFKRAYIKRFNEMEQQLKQISYSQPQLINPQPQPTSIQYFYLTSPHYFCQPYFRWKKEGEQYLMCVNDLLMLTDFYETYMPESLTRFRETTNCKWQTTEKDKVANKILFFCDFSYVRDFLYLRNNTKYRVLRVNVEREFKKTIAKLEFANNELDLTVSNNKILIEYLNEQKTLEIQELKNQLIKKDETIKLIADETSSRNTKLKIKANIVLNVNTFVFKSGYSHLDVYVYAYKQLFLMHPNVNWREEFFTSNNKLDYLMNKNISYLKELESLVLDLNLSQEQTQTVSR